MTRISFCAISKALEDIQLPSCELVVGISQGGIVPAALVACKQGCELALVQINYRNQDNLPQHPQPLLLSKPRLPEQINNILVVDDVAVSGQTLAVAKKLLKSYRVKTLVSKGKADYVLFPQLTSCVEWPWST